ELLLHYRDDLLDVEVVFAQHGETDFPSLRQPTPTQNGSLGGLGRFGHDVDAGDPAGGIDGVAGNRRVAFAIAQMPLTAIEPQGVVGLAGVEDADIHRLAGYRGE